MQILKGIGLAFLAMMLFMCATIGNHSPANTPSQAASSAPGSTDQALEEGCKYWLYARNRAFKLGKEGDKEGAEKSRRIMMQIDADLSKSYSQAEIAAMIRKLEASGYRVGF